MEVIRELPTNAEGKYVLSLGNFDGVHLGHKRLLRGGLEVARAKGLELAILLFEPHPMQVLFPESFIGFLTTKEKQMEIFEEIGVNRVYLLPFTEEIAAIPPKQFVRDFLLSMGVEHVVVGFNYSFGAKGKGTPEDLQTFGHEYGFEVSILQPQVLEGMVISSTATRKALLDGNVQLAKEFLGRPHCIVGKVVKGEQRGRQLGYPTANLQIQEGLLIPKRGVYAVWAWIDNQKVPGMMNIGMKPTFHKEYMLTVEVHFFDFHGDLYGKELTIYLEEKIRDECKFASKEELIKQLGLDAKKARDLLNQNLQE
ncbi:MAG: bifunctional riboflavin kinase/FAD synthetase [Desulfitobacterium sp.]|nr:bifunctional riboflavin kinase/FAD synthetase [Desulfitobacterium sp.]